MYAVVNNAIILVSTSIVYIVMSVYQHKFTDEEKQEIVLHVNKYRRLLGCPICHGTIPFRLFE